MDKFQSRKERLEALHTFWCVYTLERRTSLGQGVPFSIQDSHIDPSLFDMVRSIFAALYEMKTKNLLTYSQDGTDTLMKALIDWTKLAGKTWHALNSQGEKDIEIKTDELDYLDYQITRWYDDLPDHFKRQPHESGRNIQYIHTVLLQRRSHLRNLIFRPVLQSAARIAQYHRQSQRATEIAKETIQMLSSLHETTQFVQQQPVFFKHLLLAAFGNLLLAAVNASSTFCDNVKVEFDIALDMIRTLSSRSPLLMSLWKRLQGLRKLRTQLTKYSAEESVASRNSDEDEADSLSEEMIFDKLFPTMPFEPGQPSDVNGQDSVLESHLAGLFEFPDISSGVFDGAYAAW
jgi:hypothetical protein